MTSEEYNNKKKLEYFEYIIFKFKEWYEEKGGLDFCDMMSRLKAQKLLFFCAAVKNPYGEDLLNIFDNWYATETGFVESDIYQAMVDDSFETVRIKDRVFSFKTEYFQPKLSSYYKEKIDIAIGCLKAVNHELVLKHGYELSELSKCWRCWEASRFVAEFKNEYSIKMTSKEIRECDPIFKTY